MKQEKLSVFLSLILRHKPEVINIKLDNQGYANVDELITGINNYENRYIDMEILEEIVRTDNKGRYSFNEDKTKIRANQGHSIKVDVGLKECVPPDILYHGTAKRFLNSIFKEGLQKRSRLYVHLSINPLTALKVGERHGESSLLEINSGKMYKDGYKFFVSENGVWLTDNVPAEYIRY